MPLRLELIASHRIVEALRSEVFEVHCLARVGTDPGCGKHKPGEELGPSFQPASWKKLTGFLSEIKQYCVAVEHPDPIIDNRGRLRVGINGQELRLELFALAGIDRNDLVREARLL